MTSYEDLLNNLTDSLDALNALALVSSDSLQQHALRVSVGGIITAIREMLGQESSSLLVS